MQRLQKRRTSLLDSFKNSSRRFSDQVQKTRIFRRNSIATVTADPNFYSAELNAFIKARQEKLAEQKNTLPVADVRILKKKKKVKAEDGGNNDGGDSSSVESVDTKSDIQDLLDSDDSDSDMDDEEYYSYGQGSSDETTESEPEIESDSMDDADEDDNVGWLNSE